MENSKIYTIIGIIIITIILTIGVTKVYGETFEYQGSFPIPENVTNTEVKKRITHVDDTLFEFTITYRFTADEIKKWFDDITTPKGPALPDCDFGYDEVTEECVEPIIMPEIPSNFIPQEITPEQKEFESILEVLKEKTKLTQNDLDTIALIESILECERATGSAYGITQEDSFVVPETLIDPGYPVAGHIEGASGKLQLRYQECIGQLQNFDTMFGPDREPGDIVGKEGWVDYLEVPHGERAITEGWETIPNQETLSSTASLHDKISAEKEAKYEFCNDDRNADISKKDLGCPQPDYLTTAKRSSGFIHYENYAQSRYADYMNNGDAAQLDKILSDKVAAQQKAITAQRYK